MDRCPATTDFAASHGTYIHRAGIAGGMWRRGHKGTAGGRAGDDLVHAVGCKPIVKLLKRIERNGMRVIRAWVVTRVDCEGKFHDWCWNEGSGRQVVVLV